MCGRDRFSDSCVLARPFADRLYGGYGQTAPSQSCKEPFRRPVVLPVLAQMMEQSLGKHDISGPCGPCPARHGIHIRSLSMSVTLSCVTSATRRPAAYVVMSTVRYLRSRTTWKKPGNLLTAQGRWEASLACEHRE